MTTNMHSHRGSDSPNFSTLDHAKQLASILLSERGEASGALVARQLHEALRTLDADDRHGSERLEQR